MTGTSERTVDWDAFWAAHADALTIPYGIDLGEARETSVFLGGIVADATELREWLQMLGFLPYESGEPVKHRAECGAPFNAYRRPGS